jgi:hypothetical protein
MVKEFPLFFFKINLSLLSLKSFFKFKNNLTFNLNSKFNYLTLNIFEVINFFFKKIKIFFFNKNIVFKFGFKKNYFMNIYLTKKKKYTN